MSEPRNPRRISIAKSNGEVTIRFQWVPVFVRWAMLLFLALASTILATDHGGKPWSLRLALELAWAGMVLALVAAIAINSTCLQVTAEAVRMRTTPVGLLEARVLPRSEIRAVHHWMYWLKRARYRVAIQTESPVQVGTFETREEARLVAEAIAGGLRVECREAPPGRGFDWVVWRRVLAIAAGLSAPLAMVLLLEIWRTGD